MEIVVAHLISQMFYFDGDIQKNRVQEVFCQNDIYWAVNFFSTVSQNIDVKQDGEKIFRILQLLILGF